MLRARLRESPSWDDGAPIRAELFSVERLEEHARSLAAAQDVDRTAARGASLAARLDDNEAILQAAYRDVVQAIDEGAAITPAAEWLVDNFHVIEKQMREIRSDLPAGYYRQLPKLASGPFVRYPRVFGLIWAFVAHTDSLFDPDALCAYLRAYQQVQPLMIGELWAVATTLRIVLVENLRRIARRVMDSRAGRSAADALADRLLGSGGRAAEPASAVLPPIGRARFSDAFLVQLTHRLRDQDPGIAPALVWLDEQLAVQGATAEAVVRDEHQRQVAGSITVRNIITSMRLVNDVDWTELFERVSPVDDVFRDGDGFLLMDFPTRDLYRRAVEELARGSPLTELQVAAAAVAWAKRAEEQGGAGEDDRRAEPGYYLIAAGRAAFEHGIGFRPPLAAWPARLYRTLGIGGYVSAGAIVAASFLALAFSVLVACGLPGQWLPLFALLGAVPAIDLAVALVNFTVTRGYPATLLPALELAGGVPPEFRTMIAVPVLLSNREDVEEQIRQLEIHYLASPEGELYFALLSDWPDADCEQLGDDDDQLQAAKDAVAALNRRYGPAADGDRFLLLHRRRCWNKTEGRWIGWERKRGKLSELNRLLCGDRSTTFIDPPRVPENVRYVITLDADTRLPRETVRRLIGKMAHPLNRPRFDTERRRVVEGYAVLQPRVTAALPVGHEGSLFLRLFSRATGIDPYAAAVSDVYQDLFGEGSYTGKGIYDVEAFEAALRGRVPDETLLSHDLFEGVFARAGLASDVEVVESFPAHYDKAALRHHRWVRGDWQLTPWILGLVPKTEAGAGSTGLPAIGRWKMLDNLRRSLSSPSIVAALIFGWAFPLPVAAAWSGFVLATMAIPPALPLFADLVSRRPGVTLLSHYRALGAESRLAVQQFLLMMVFLGHQAWLMADAILRTLVRLSLTRRHLLQWTPSAQSAFAGRPGVGPYYRRMAGGIVVAFLGVAVAAIWSRNTLPLAGAFALAWTLSPAVAFYASQSPQVPGRRPLADPDARALRLIARRTWRFFETFVTDEHNQLPPDNFQETPEPVVATRTSPTNIGLYLLAIAVARDFGWLSTGQALNRLEATLATMDRMAKHRGHLLNWYDTRDLRPLDPPYVSSVDSGNLAGHLVALANWCEAAGAKPQPAWAYLDGVADALELLRQDAERLMRRRAGQEIGSRRLDEAIGQVAGALAAIRLAGSGADLDAGLAEQVQLLVDTVHDIALEDPDESIADLVFWAAAVRNGVAVHNQEVGGDPAADLTPRLSGVAGKARAMALGMEFGFLVDSDRLLLSIGYRVAEGALDPNCYDLLASEARLASFFGIAKRDLPARHWFRLGRAVTPVGRGAALISWSGSMFEYLMPSLVMQAPADSLIEETNRLIVQKQTQYAVAPRAPWGVSESAYNARDLDFTYQYSNFGVPGLGLKRGLADSSVVAPYATALAAMVDPTAAARNFEHLTAIGAQGRFGFYEALDFTLQRAPPGEPMAIVRAYMAHHQGMTVTAIADALMDGMLRRCFHAEPIVQATELLLQEAVPREITATPPSVSATASAAHVRQADEPGLWRNASPHGASPATQLLSNGRYTVMLTAAGSGYSAWRDLAVTRWREDATCDDWGSYLFLRDASTGEVWSPTYQPLGPEPSHYEVVFNEDRVEFVRRDADWSSSMEVLVSAEDDAEVRRLTISNLSDVQRELEVTSYAELVLAPQAADQAHAAFSKLFVETEHLAGLGALVAHRRRRSPSDPDIWAAHLAVVRGETVGVREFETDRAKFLGRGGGVRAPAAVRSGRPLSGSAGTVLDPIFALRRRVRVAPGATVRLDFWTMVAGSRQTLLGLVDKHHDVGAFDRAAALAWTQAQVELHHLGAGRPEAGWYQRLAAHLIYAVPTLRASSDAITAGGGSQQGLWPMGISGDLPILLVRISEVEQLALVREALLAVEYWRMKRLAVDLVILNERAASYVQDLQVGIETLVRASQSRPQSDGDRPPGGIFILRADLIAPEQARLLASVARIILVGDRGRLVDQLERAPEAPPAPRAQPRPSPTPSELQLARPAPGVEFFNGLGGFVEDGREYLIVLGPGQATPAPWINVIANPVFGFQAPAEGGGYAWSMNSREHQLTSWSNDPVSARPGQAFYLKDLDRGELWSPTATPIRNEAATYEARHGWGYSRFRHTSNGIASDLLEFVPLHDPIKISRLKLRNLTGRRRRLSVTAYAEWVLGSARPGAAPFIRTRIDPASNAVLADNPWNAAFADRVAFLDLAGRQTSWTGDRREFIGRNGGLEFPAALASAQPLSGRVGSGLDPCAALQAQIVIEPYGEMEIVCCLGDGEDEAGARELIARYRAADLDGCLADVRRFWDDTVGQIQVRTPDRSIDVMLNGWLIYQTLASRVWARCGFYQASGAYGFRDQLQDGMALASICPEQTREHLLRAAGRQFPEGDVQHWWLPHSGQGVRTMISDDRAWLAYAAAHYVRTTGDWAVMDEPVPFIDGPPLNEGEHDSFFQPEPVNRTASLFEHCALALDASLAVGRHGLPLMGTGDWNDGMNRVGEGGQGESVWLGWLLYAALEAFAGIAERRGEGGRAAIWRAHMGRLQSALETEAWDGDWYRRAWYDNGAPLGSAFSEECRLDAISQSWAVLSGAALPERAAQAMAAVERDLILPNDGVALLFTPPFDRTPLDPGYIKGYPPGLRENGGQYTHAALWSVLAFAELGEGDKAAALFWLLNPVNHARTRADMHRYKVEPYVVAADVYSAPGHVGRGGWTWYTGSAGWMQRAGVEGILGVHIEGDRLRLDPCVPSSWPGFQVTLRRGASCYEIEVSNPSGVQRGVRTATLDETTLEARPLLVPFVDDGRVHHVRVVLG
ncbi:glycosyl transferase [Phenylobacterium montanum]|uniref:Glycosyl transferase n=2 Tax=Phenylobacterium montanum TaxID=2823693 RepID=A0A975G4V2_9CAUL|nr:glycosyl transferase [Caulobacter sp. S6]